MALDLETLRTEIQAYLDESEAPVFYGQYRMLDALNQIIWDTERHPDFRDFISAGQKAGAKLIVFTHRAFSLDLIHEALDQLNDADLAREEKRSFEKSLQQLQAYEGFTCSLELSFAVDSQIYTFELQTDWYQKTNDILAELDGLLEDQEEADSNGDSLGGYFSKN